MTTTVLDHTALALAQFVAELDQSDSPVIAPRYGRLIAAAKPSTLAEVEAIRGIGPKTVEKVRAAVDEIVARLLVAEQELLAKIRAAEADETVAQRKVDEQAAKKVAKARDFYSPNTDEEFFTEYLFARLDHYNRTIVVRVFYEDFRERLVQIANRMTGFNTLFIEYNGAETLIKLHRGKPYSEDHRELGPVLDSWWARNGQPVSMRKPVRLGGRRRP